MEITKLEFSEAFSLYEMGNADSCLIILNDKIKKQAKTFDGVDVNLENCRERYAKYIQWWKSKYGKNDHKYVAKVNQKATVYDFLLNGLYNNSYVIEEQPRDNYLFGDASCFPRQDIILQTKEFIKNARKKTTQ